MCEIRVIILLLLDDVVKPGHDLGSGERTEPEPCAPRLECRNDLAQVVADHTEPHIVCELLNNWNKASNLTLSQFLLRRHR